MATKAISKEARRAARAAAAASQEELARRTRANVEDLAAFFSARERAEAVDDWLAERQRALREQAEERRSAQRRQCGVALAAMRDRGESLREIAHMAAVSEKAVRDLIREAEASAGVDAAAAAEGPALAEAAGRPATPAGGAGRVGLDVGPTQAVLG